MTSRHKELFLDIRHLSQFTLLSIWHVSMIPVRMLATRPHDSFWGAFGESLAQLLEQMGPAYIKFGQLLSTRRHQFPDAFVSRLARLQDRVQANDAPLTREHIESVLGKAAAERFSTIDDPPIAIGSIAVVYAARLVDGRRVAVKVVRANAFNEAHRAVSTIQRVIRYVSAISDLARLPVAEAIQDVCKALIDQFDLNRERWFNLRLHQIFCHDKRVRLPIVLPALSCKQFMTMEFLDELQKLSQESKEDWYETSLRLGFRTLFKMILEHGIVHCDFHAGNVFFDRNSITILDTGFMEELNAVETYQFREFFIGILLGDGQRCSKILIESASRIDPNCDRSKFESEISGLVSEHCRARAAEFRVANFVHRLFEIQGRCGVKGSHRFTMTILSLLVYEGMAATFIPDADFQREAIPIVGPILVRRGF